jgi:4-amino-4-deoxy-L-arabinose transferase-like glycosyltransferase
MKNNPVIKRVKSFVKNNLFLTNSVLFAVFCMLLLVFAKVGYSILPFDTIDYTYQSHHFLPDDNIEQDHQARTMDFQLTTALAVYDSNFYLFMGDALSQHGGWQISDDIRSNQNMSWAFAPAYPVILAFINLIFNNIFLTAFVVNFILAILAFMVIYCVIRKLKGESLAAKVAWFTMLVPGALFTHLYFSESLALIFIALLILAYAKKNYLLASIVTGLLVVTRFQAVLLLPLLWFILLRKKQTWKLSVKQILSGLMLSVLPLLIWVIFVWTNTGDPLYWLSIRSQWTVTPLGLIVTPVLWIMDPSTFHMHNFNFSLIDFLIISASGILLWLSKRELPKIQWWIAFLLWVLPNITNGTISGLRYQVLLIPLYVFLMAKIKKPWLVTIIFTALIISQFILILLAVNYYWIG